MADPFSLDGRVAVVTGAGSGIGRAVAMRLAGAGAMVVCADLAGEAAEATAAAIGAAGGQGRPAVVDVTDRTAVADLVAGAGPVEVMCNVAGIIGMAAVVDITEEELDRVLAVNFKGVLWGCQAAGRVMAGAGRGSIVNMASAAIDTPSAGLVAYGAAKAAVVQLTRVMAAELGRSGVRVNAVAPGYVETAMTGRAYVGPDGTVDEEARAKVLAGASRGVPLGRIGQPDDIAWSVLYLASDASAWTTGQILRPNGGVAMPW